MKHLFWLLLIVAPSIKAQSKGDTLLVLKTTDFALDGSGMNKAWQKASWITLPQLDPGVENYDSKFKIMYSATGIYVLFEGKDKKITGNYKEDFSDMYNADVFEVFFHPEPPTPLYFEYEINAYDKELVLLIPNLDGKIMGWRPWHYETSRLIKHKVKVQSKNGAMASWSAELFFPYTLLAPLQKVPPVSGMHWNANFCRLDYDPGKMVKWSWSPVQASFHEFKQFRTIRFE